VAYPNLLQILPQTVRARIVVRRLQLRNCQAPTSNLRPKLIGSFASEAIWPDSDKSVTIEPDRRGLHMRHHLWVVLKRNRTLLIFDRRDEYEANRFKDCAALRPHLTCYGTARASDTLAVRPATPDERER
jgi:hypothetical protein